MRKMAFAAFLVFAAMLTACAKEQDSGPHVILNMQKGHVVLTAEGYNLFNETQITAPLTKEFSVPDSVVILKKMTGSKCVYILLFNEQKYGSFVGLPDQYITLTPANEVSFRPSCGITLVRWLLGGSSL